MQKLKKSSCRFWIDLGEFSGEGKDYGVKESIAKWGFIPDAIAMFSTCPDFVHEHDGKIDDTKLRWEYSTYNGWNHKRRWTRKEYKGVVKELKKYGIKVFLCCMSTAYQPSFEKFSKWAKSNKEILLLHNTGLTGFTDEGLFADMCYYHIAAKFKNGTFYEDFFSDQVTKTVKDYGFDGFLAADGYKSFILGIMAAGFSRDILEQFEEYSGIKLPSYKKGKLTEVIPPVAKWIWKNQRNQWIEFWKYRFDSGWKKVATKLKKSGKEFSIISAWNTDPLESISRYGMDTKMLEDIGTESMYFETHDIHSITGPIAGPKSKSRDGYLLEGNTFYCCSQMSALFRGTHTQKMKNYPMIHIHDQFERFEFLKSGRSYLEKAIVGYQQLYRIQNAKLKPASDGVWYAIPCNVSADDWRFLYGAEKLARSITPAQIPGSIVLWSESTVENEMDSSSNKWSVHRTSYELAAAGCPVITAAKVDEIDNLKNQILLWSNPKSFTKEEQAGIWKNIKAAKNRAVIFDSKGQFVLPKQIKSLQIIDGHTQARFALTGNKSQLETAKKKLLTEAEFMKSKGLVKEIIKSQNKITITSSQKPEAYEYSEEMESHFITRIPPYRLSSEYMTLCAMVAHSAAWPLIDDIRVFIGPRAGEIAGNENNIFYIKDKKGDLYLLALNLHKDASYLKLKWSKSVVESRPLNSALYQPAPEGKEVELMIPAWGISVYKINLK